MKMKNFCVFELNLRVVLKQKFLFKNRSEEIGADWKGVGDAQ